MSFNLSELLVDTMLDKLATEVAFCALFADDPRGALASIGFAAAADTPTNHGAWSCLHVTELASKDAIRRGRAQLR